MCVGACRQHILELGAVQPNIEPIEEFNICVLFLHVVSRILIYFINMFSHWTIVFPINSSENSVHSPQSMDLNPMKWKWMVYWFLPACFGLSGKLIITNLFIRAHRTLQWTKTESSLCWFLYLFASVRVQIYRIKSGKRKKKTHEKGQHRQIRNLYMRKEEKISSTRTR